MDVASNNWIGFLVFFISFSTLVLKCDDADCLLSGGDTCMTRLSRDAPVRTRFILIVKFCFPNKILLLLQTFFFFVSPKAQEKQGFDDPFKY